MHELYELKELLCKELEEYGSKGELTAGTLETVDKLAHAAKNVGKLIEMYEEEEYSSAYNGSYAGGGQGGGSYARGGGQSRNSYARGRGRNARRDSMGRYSRESRYSREGYSQGGEELSEMIRSMINELPQNAQMDAQRLADKLDQSMR